MLTVVTPAASDALVSLEEVKAELGISGTSQDTYLTSLIQQASDALAHYCGRDTFARQVYRQTERITGRRASIVLDRDIDPAVSAVTEDGTVLDPAAWELDGSLLYRLSGDQRAAWGRGVVVVDYAAGYTLPMSTPGDLARACLIAVTALWSAKGRDPMLRSESTEGVGATQWFAGGGAASRGLPSDALALIEPYRKWC